VDGATAGASGAEDTFRSPPSRELKSEIREKEQAASCQFFGLPKDRLTFLRFEEDGDGHPLENQPNTKRLRQLLLDKRPAMVFLPHGNDTNLGHQRVYSMFRQIAPQLPHPVIVFLNRDPKTIHMRCDVYSGYGKEMAAWKAKLLRFHDSQHQRNLNQRKHGFDERILMADGHNARECSLEMPYAEAFEIESFGCKGLKDIVGF